MSVRPSRLRLGSALRDPLCPVMRQSDIETFRAPTMIAGSFGRYPARSARDHENRPSRGAAVRSHVANHRDSWATDLARRAGGTRTPTPKYQEEWDAHLLDKIDHFN